MNLAYKPSANGFVNNSPKLCVIHAIGQYIDTDGVDYHATEWLDKLGLSAHYLIDQSVVIKTREETQGGFHAKGFNTDSIGIEILVPGLHDYATFLEAIKTPYIDGNQYQLLIDLCKEIISRHPHIVFKRHSDLSPERKFDPGAGFDWGKFLNNINQK
jgi:N-acetyl-anhydromuramyl-L-alanine amidase AmpD